MADSLIRMQFGGSETNLEKLPTQASVLVSIYQLPQSMQIELF